MAAPQDTEQLLHHIGELIRAERLNEAAEALRAASERDPANSVLLVTLGDVLALAGRTIPARRCYQRALERDPTHSVARVQLARLLARQGDTTQAIKHYREAIMWRADTVPAYTELAALLTAGGDHAGAIEVLTRLREKAPDSTEALIALGNLLMSMGRYSEAEDCFRKALAVSAQQPDVLARLGASLRAQDRFDEARVALVQALGTAPRLAVAARQLADLHWDLGQRDEALRVLKAYLAHQPSDATVQHELAARLESIGFDDEARVHYDAALALEPTADDTTIALGLLELRTGNFAQGWSGAWLAARRKLLANNPQESLPRDVALPRDLEGKTVLLGADGGIENELFFLRYAPQLKARGARVLYRASADTEMLLRHRPVGLDAIVSQSDAIPPCEGSLYVSALPLALAQLEAKLPASLRLEPNAARLKFWRERLAEMGEPPYTAIAWRAGAAPETNTPELTPTAPPAAPPLGEIGKVVAACRGTLVSIQRLPKPGETEELSTAAGRDVHDASRVNDDLEDILALLALVDEYICVSDAHTHLRICVGRPARVLVPWRGHWWWMNQGSESPWFPGFTLYRQQPDGSWSRALAQLAADLGREHNS